MKQLKLTFGGQSFYADLLEDKTPEICSALIKAAPFQSYWFVAKICDNEVCFRAPFVCEAVENPVFNKPGDIGWFDTRQLICVWYNDMVPLGCTSKFAQFSPQENARFLPFADAMWEKPGELVTVEVVEKEA